MAEEVKQYQFQQEVDTALSKDRVTLNALYPKEFDVYMLTLELTDAEDNILSYFTFPINPDSMTKSQPTVKTIDRTSGAIVVNKTGMFVPQDIVIKGNFGRAFKYINTDGTQSEAFNATVSGFSPNRTEFSQYVKNGYGCFKILQGICEDSDKLDDNNKPKRLYLHNLALGESYLVEVINFQASQSVGQNMIWGYDLRLKIVSPILVESTATDEDVPVVTVADDVIDELEDPKKNLWEKLLDVYNSVIDFRNKVEYFGSEVQKYENMARHIMQNTMANIMKVKAVAHDIIDYYKGVADGTNPKDWWSITKKVISDAKNVYNVTAHFNSSIYATNDFVIFDMLEDGITDMETIMNLSRWIKSSKEEGVKNDDKSTVKKVLKQQQTLENLAKAGGYVNQDEGALDLALKNYIKETDYDLDGGFSISFSSPSSQSLKLNSVVDTMVGENLLGKDIQRKLEFSDNDLVALSPTDTFVQTCEIFTGLTKNSNPEFPDDGFDKSSISNKSVMNCRVSSFIRQMSAVVKRDDTIAGFSVSNVTTEGDAIRIDMEFRSHLNNGETIRSSVYGN